MLLNELLKDDFSLSQALNAVGLSLGDFKNMSSEQFANFRKNQIKNSHPDNPDNHSKNIDLQTLNRAFDVLKNIRPELLNNSNFRKSNNPTIIVPKWQPDKHAMNNKIHNETYRDQNFIKKHIWEISGESGEIYTIDAFSGDSFQSRLKVYGSPNVFEDMAQAMRVWNANGANIDKATRAVFVSSKDHPKTLFLIYADGRSFAQRPLPLDYTGTSQYDDKNFQQKIVSILDKIQRMYKGKQSYY
jgi:hypothetical protein